MIFECGPKYSAVDEKWGAHGRSLQSLPGSTVKAEDDRNVDPVVSSLYYSVCHNRCSVDNVSNKSAATLLRGDSSIEYSLCYAVADLVEHKEEHVRPGWLDTTISRYS